MLEIIAIHIAQARLIEYTFSSETQVAVNALYSSSPIIFNMIEI